MGGVRAAHARDVRRVVRGSVQLDEMGGVPRFAQARRVGEQPEVRKARTGSGGWLPVSGSGGRWMWVIERRLPCARSSVRRDELDEKGRLCCARRGGKRHAHSVVCLISWNF